MMGEFGAGGCGGKESIRRRLGSWRLQGQQRLIPWWPGLAVELGFLAAARAAKADSVVAWVHGRLQRLVVG
ncbi:hypothetical protein M0R45_026152 [Rubus argutus]|uniref:Uncharacterized protein n=1 Tax=Rubus argutus TaxID=59490 RepID=A0AAW1X033_RUBAR